MKLHFTVTEQAYLDFNIDHIEHSDSLRKAAGRARLIVPLVLLFIGASFTVFIVCKFGIHAFERGKALAWAEFAAFYIGFEAFAAGKNEGNAIFQVIHFFGFGHVMTPVGVQAVSARKAAGFECANRPRVCRQ